MSIHRTDGVVDTPAPEFKLVGKADFHMSAELDVCIGDELYIRRNAGVVVDRHETFCTPESKSK
jgi:hypothetical protein